MQQIAALRQSSAEITGCAQSPNQLVKICVNAEGTIIETTIHSSAFKKMTPQALALAITDTAQAAVRVLTHNLDELLADPASPHAKVMKFIERHSPSSAQSFAALDMPHVSTEPPKPDRPDDNDGFMRDPFGRPRTQ